MELENESVAADSPCCCSCRDFLLRHHSPARIAVAIHAADRGAGDSVTVTIYRNKKRMEIKVVLGETRDQARPTA